MRAKPLQKISDLGGEMFSNPDVYTCPNQYLYMEAKSRYCRMYSLKFKVTCTSDKNKDILLRKKIKETRIKRAEKWWLSFICKNQRNESLRGQLPGEGTWAQRLHFGSPAPPTTWSRLPMLYPSLQEGKLWNPRARWLPRPVDQQL